MVISESPDSEGYLPEGLGIPRNPKLSASAGEDLTSVHEKGKPRSEILVDGLLRSSMSSVLMKKTSLLGFLNGMNVPD
ncbi:hypothetical protein MASR2M79_21700 [Aminivibrio sp.]